MIDKNRTKDFYRQMQNLKAEIRRAGLLQMVFYGALGLGSNYFTMYYRRILVYADGTVAYELIGTILLVQSLIAFTAPLIAGILADKYKIENRLISLFSIMVALGAGILATAGTSLAADWSLSQKMGLILAGSMIYSFALKPIIPLIDTGTLKALNTLDGNSNNYGRIRLFGSVGWVFCCILMGFWLNRTQNLMHAIAALGAAYIILATIAVGGFRSEVKKNTIPWQYLKADKNLRRICILGFIRTLGFTGAFTYTGIYFEDLALGYPAMGLAFGLAALPEIPLFLLARRMMAKHGSKGLIIFGLMLQIIRLGLLAIFTKVGSPVFYIAVQLLMGAGFCLYITGVVTMLDRKAPSDLKATYQNLYHLVGAVATIPAGFLASLAVSAWGTQVLMGIASFSMILTLLYAVGFVTTE